MANKKRKVYKKKTKNIINKNKNNVTTNTNASVKKRTSKKGNVTSKKTTSVKKKTNTNKPIEVVTSVDNSEIKTKKVEEKVDKEQNDKSAKQESKQKVKKQTKKTTKAKEQKEKVAEEKPKQKEKAVEKEPKQEEKVVEEESKQEEKVVEEESKQEEKVVEEEPKQEEKAVEEEPKQEEKAVEEEPKQEEKAVEEEPKQEEKAVEEEPKQEEKAVEEEPKQEEKAAEIEIKGQIFKSRIVLYIALIILFFILFFGILVIKEKKDDTEDIKFETINLKKYLNLYKENHDLEYVYITDNSCLKCNEYEVSLKKIENDLKIKIKKLNITNFSEKDLIDLENSNSFIVDIKDVPFLVSVKDKETISVISGIKEYSAVKNFVTYSNNPSNKSFNKISVDKYLSLLNSKDSILIYIGTSSDSACERFSSTLEKVSSSKGIRVYYLNTDDIVTDEGINKLNESDEIFSKQWFVPTLLIVKNGVIKDYRMYAMSEEELIRFLDKNKM